MVKLLAFEQAYPHPGSEHLCFFKVFSVAIKGCTVGKDSSLAAFSDRESAAGEVLTRNGLSVKGDAVTFSNSSAKLLSFGAQGLAGRTSWSSEPVSDTNFGFFLVDFRCKLNYN